MKRGQVIFIILVLIVSYEVAARIADPEESIGRLDFGVRPQALRLPDTPLNPIDVQSSTAKRIVVLPESEKHPIPTNSFAYPKCELEAKKSIVQLIYPSANSTELEDLVLNLDSLKDSFKTLSSSEEAAVGETCETGLAIWSEVNQNNFVHDIYTGLRRMRTRRNPFSRTAVSRLSSQFENCQRKHERKHQELFTYAKLAYEPGNHIVGQKLPYGHTLKKVFDDPSGFKAMVSENEDEMVLSIAGTEDVTDWLANISFGSGQWQSHREEIVSLFIEAARSGKKVSFTGHSLGGALAQAFAYDVSHRLKELDPRGFTQGKYDDISTVTFNAFGANDLIKIKFPRLDSDLTGSAFDRGMVHYGFKNDQVFNMGNFPFGQRRELSTSGIETDMLGINVLGAQIGGGRGNISKSWLDIHNTPAIEKAMGRNGISTSIPMQDNGYGPSSFGDFFYDVASLSNKIWIPSSLQNPK